MNFSSKMSLLKCRHARRTDWRLIQRLYSTTSIKPQNTDTHNPAEFESIWYSKWQEKLQKINKDNTRKTFCLINPPPNVTGTLHLGHAITATIQDIIVRWKLMNNHRVFWFPGTDHAGIATQVVVERKIWNEKKLTRHDLGKEKFKQEVIEWKNSKTTVIRNQLIQMNALLDWNNEYFTMDERISASVNEAFVRLYERNLIVRALRPINWCCALKSTISDIEIDNRLFTTPTSLRLPNYKKSVEMGYIYTFSYPIHESKGETISVATTRPETLFGDVAIAVNPADTRYTKLHGKCAFNPFTKQLMPIILDENVDQSFETGAVKITPSHDFNDYAMSQRHKLPLKTILDDEGKLINVPEQYMNTNRFDARQLVLNQLQNLGLFKSKKAHEMNVPFCSRTGDVLEPMLKEQWFVKTEEMFKNCTDAVQNGTLQLIPEWRSKLWNQYATAYTKDWCISRQLWWGQQIPAFKCTLKSDENASKWFAARNINEARAKAIDHFKTSEINIKQDEDVFDTWFSSTILPLAIFGWPNPKTEMNGTELKLNDLYPTDLLETGYDIMFFWVLRMAAMCHALSDKFPFRQVLFHGLVLDSQGRKMSKSIGNVIDPMDLINGASLTELENRVKESNLDEKEKKTSLKNQQLFYPNGIPQVGSDTTRLALLLLDFKSDNINVDLTNFIANKHFCNKIWQATRYVENFLSEKQANMKLMSLNEIMENKNCRLVDKWIILNLLQLVKNTEGNFNNGYNLHTILLNLRAFFLSNFCDFYIECTKVWQKSSGVDDNAELAWNVLRNCINTSLFLYHPFIPSVTEQLWDRLKGLNRLNDDNKLLIEQNYPKSSDFNFIMDVDFVQLNSSIDVTQKIINTILSLKKSFKIPSKDKTKVFINCNNKASVLNQHLRELQNEIGVIAKLSEVHYINSKFNKKNSKQVFEIEINADCRIFVEFEQIIDVSVEINRLAKQKEKILTEMKRLETRLSKEPVEKCEKPLNELKEKLSKINSQLNIISS